MGGGGGAQNPLVRGGSTPLVRGGGGGDQGLRTPLAPEILPLPN